MKSKIVIRMSYGTVTEVCIVGEGEPDQAIIMDNDTNGYTESQITQDPSDHSNDFFVYEEDISPLSRSPEIARIVYAFWKREHGNVEPNMESNEDET